jgi:hypothetical protein
MAEQGKPAKEISDRLGVLTKRAGTPGLSMAFSPTAKVS